MSLCYENLWAFASDNDAFEQILKSRGLPSVLIFNLDIQLMYASVKARHLLSANESLEGVSIGEHRIPREIYELCTSLINNENSYEDRSVGSFRCNDDLYAIRAFPLYSMCEMPKPSLIVVSIEKCALSRSLNVEIDKLVRTYELTNREAEVVSELLKGSTNIEISYALGITENTAKDYVKRVKNKLGVNNRSSILARVFELCERLNTDDD